MGHPWHETHAKHPFHILCIKALDGAHTYTILIVLELPGYHPLPSWPTPQPWLAELQSIVYQQAEPRIHSHSITNTTTIQTTLTAHNQCFKQKPPLKLNMSCCIPTLLIAIMLIYKGFSFMWLAIHLHTSPPFHHCGTSIILIPYLLATHPQASNNLCVKDLQSLMATLYCIAYATHPST